MAEPPVKDLIRSFAALARHAPRALPFEPADVVTVTRPAPVADGSFASDEPPPAFHMRAVLPSKSGREVFVTLVEVNGGRLRLRVSSDAVELAGGVVRVVLGGSSPTGLDVSERVVLAASTVGGCGGEADLGPFAAIRERIGTGDIRLGVVLVEPRLQAEAEAEAEADPGPAPTPPAEGSLAHAAWPDPATYRFEPISHTMSLARPTECALTLG